MATGRFDKYSLPNAGTCNNGNLGDLPGIHRERWWGLSLTELGLARSEWDAGKESVNV